MAQVYKITNITNQRIYIGIVIRLGKTHLDRFQEHMIGKGSRWIKYDLDNGLASPQDFVVELLEDNNDVDYIAQQEEHYIIQFNSLYPYGYNGNIGKCIVVTQETIQKSISTRRKHLLEGKFSLKGLNKGKANFRYPDGTVRKLPIDHDDVVSGLVKHVNYNEKCAGRVKFIKESLEKIKNGGYTDKHLAHINNQRELWKTVHTNEWWVNGRQTYRDRLAKNNITEKERELWYERRPDIVKAQWATVSPEDKTARTAPGLTSMNSSIQCEHCGKISNKGNYSRWHGPKCKKSQ